jgi:urea transporter
MSQATRIDIRSSHAEGEWQDTRAHDKPRGWSLLKPQLPKYKPAPFFVSVFRCYSEVFFINGGPLFGASIFAATMLNWNVGLAGVIAVVAAYLFARLIGLDQEFFRPGFYTFNPLLIGLSLGAILQLSWLSVFFIVNAAVLTLLMTIVLVHVFRYYFNMPVLSLPFAVCSVIANLAALRYADLVDLNGTSGLLSAEDVLPLLLSGFCRSLGSIFFLPHEFVGILLGVLLLSRSRILFLLAVVGYYTGTTVRAVLLGSVEQAFGDSSFDFILIAIVLGGVFLTPSVYSYIIAIVAVIVSTIFLDAAVMFGSQHDIPVHTLTFNFISLGVIYTLALTAPSRLPRSIGLTPEQTLENDAVYRQRFQGSVRTLSLPFFGKWTVSQAFEDEWTHQGTWRFAYDFVITDDNGNSCEGTGINLEDYYCWRKPVLAPTRGRVSAVVNDLPDNPISQSDKANNWGNYVVIYDERGFYVEVSHLAQGSIKVKPGDWVEPTTILGLCGNSGYSLQPHLHIHVQVHERVGSATLPFSFVAYLQSNRYHANAIPEKNDQVEPAPVVDPHLDAATDFVLGDEITYDVYDNGTKVDTVTWRVIMALDGSFCFETPLGRLYFGKEAGTFYFYRADGTDPYLKLMWLALPRLPLSYQVDMQWEDYVPVSLVARGLKQVAADLAASITPSLATIKVDSSFQSPMVIESKVQDGRFNSSKDCRIDFDAERGFARIQVADIELRRADPIGPSPVTRDAEETVCH